MPALCVSQPNIVPTVADDLGCVHLGPNGQTKIRTADIGTMAANGMRFPQEHAGSTVCAPSRSVLIAGLNIGQASIPDNPGDAHLANDDLTVAEFPEWAGYATGTFGERRAEIGSQPWPSAPLGLRKLLGIPTVGPRNGGEPVSICRSRLATFRWHEPSASGAAHSPPSVVTTLGVTSPRR